MSKKKDGDDFQHDFVLLESMIKTGVVDKYHTAKFVDKITFTSNGNQGIKNGAKG